MKHTTKKWGAAPGLLAKAVALLLCLCMLPWTALAADPADSVGYTNNFEGENALEYLNRFSSAGCDYNSSQASSVVEDTANPGTHGKVWKLGNHGEGLTELAYGARYSSAYGDQTLKFDLRTDSTSDSEAPFISLRRTNNNGSEKEGYAVKLYNDAVGIGKEYDAEKTENKISFPESVQNRGTGWHTYEISVTDYKVTVKMDGTQIGSWTDETKACATGGFAFWGWRHEVYIDNIEYKATGEIPAAAGRIALNHSEFDLNLNSMFDLPLYVETYYPVGNDNTTGEGCYTEPSNSGKVTWTSSNPGVATVDSRGRVHPVSVGTTTITAVHSDYYGHEATCTVNVYQDSACTNFLYVSPDGNDSNAGTEGAPLKTIEAARDKIHAMASLPEGGVTVILKDGSYVVDETIEFTPADSGTKGSPVVYKAEHPGKAIITGEQAITGWAKAGNVEGLSEAAQGNVYVADVETGWRFHDLYVNGQRQQVSRSENTDAWRNWPMFNRAPISYDAVKGTKVTFAEGELDGLDGNQDVEVVMLPVMYWNSIPVVTEIDSASCTAYLQSQIPSNFWTDKFEYGYYNILNTLKYLDQPGEWCVDSANGKVYYWPQSEETINADSIVAPKPYELISLQGDKVDDSFEKLVEYIAFEGIAFHYTDRLPENQIPKDWVIRNAENPDAAIYLDGTRHIRIQNCEIAHSGAYAIMVNHYGQYNEIVHNNMHDLGSGGVEFFGYGVGTVDVNQHNFVLYNSIYNMGVAPYQHSPAVSVFGSGRNTIGYNYIAGAPYAAISIVGTDENSVSATNPNTRAAYDLFGNQAMQYGIRFEDLEQLSEEDKDGNQTKGEYFTIQTLAAKYQHSNCNVAEYNILQDYSQSMDDGGALYSWYSGLGNTYAYNILNEELTGARTWVFWLYMDDRAIDFTLANNLCSGNFNATINKSFAPYENRWLSNAYAKQPAEPDGYAEQRQKILNTVQSAAKGFILPERQKPLWITPVSGTQSAGVPTTFHWTSCPNASSYTLEVATDADFANVVLKQKIFSNVFTTDELAYNTTYYARVTTREYLTASQVSEAITFSTGSAPLPENTPANAAASADIDGILLQWSDPGKNTVNVYRKAKGETDFRLIAERIGGAGTLDKAVEAGTTYAYQLALVNDSGVGPRTESLEATAPVFMTLFEDDFEGEEIDAAWQDSTGARPENVQTTDGFWAVNATGVNWKEYFVNNGTEEWTDYSLEMDITYVEPMSGQETWSGFGPIFRADETNGNRKFYQLTVNSQSGPFQLAAALDSINWYHFDALSNTPPANNTLYHLRVECIGRILRYYMDDVLLYEAEATDPKLASFTHGGIGIGFGKEKILVDNVVVHGLKPAEIYAITVAEMEHGKVETSATEAEKDTIVTVTVAPDEGYRLKEGSLKANDVAIENNQFTMPAEAVTITAAFEKIPVPVNKDALRAAIADAEALDGDNYTVESWSSLQKALAKAKAALWNEHMTQEAVNTEEQTLRDAMNALEKKEAKPEEPNYPAYPTLPTEPATPAMPFRDVSKDNWYYGAVKYVYDNDLMNGVQDDRFSPEAETTRAMIVTILYRQSGSPDVRSDGASWWSDARVWAMANGVSDGTNMEGAITREQLAAMLYRFAQQNGADVSAKGDVSRFADHEQISDWALEPMRWAVGAGILSGRTNGTLDPKGLATRAEVAAMLMRFCENVIG